MKKPTLIGRLFLFCTLFVLNLMILCILLRNVNVDFITFYNDRKRYETLNNGAEGSG